MLKSTIKRLTVIFPIVFMLLLSCLSSGTAFAAADPDYPNDIDTDYSAFPTDRFNVSGLQSYFSKDRVRVESLNRGTSMKNFDYYFYCVLLDSVYPNNGKYSLISSIFCFNSSDVVYEDSTVISFSLQYCFKFIINTGSPFTSVISTSPFSPSSTYFSYDKRTGHCDYSSNYTYVEGSNLADKYYFYQETNLPNFPYCESVASPSGSSNVLDVSVSFSPDLSGVVDTTILDHGVKTESKYFNMTLLNHSSTSLQYFLCIVDHDYDVFSNNSFGASSYGSSVHYILIRDEWFAAYQSGQDHAIKSYGSCEWHPCAVGSASLQTVSWSQMKLFADFTYDVVVYAIPLDDSSTVNLYIDSYQGFDLSIQEVYRSSFSLKKKTNFNPNDDTRGNLPFVTGQELDRDQIYQYYDSDGQLQTAPNGKRFTREDVYNNELTGSVVNHSGYFNQTSSSNFNSLSSSITGFLAFFNRVWSYLPSNFASLIGLSITSLVVIAIFKGVFR